MPTLGSHRKLTNRELREVDGASEHSPDELFLLGINNQLQYLMGQMLRFAHAEEFDDEKFRGAMSDLNRSLKDISRYVNLIEITAPKPNDLFESKIHMEFTRLVMRLNFAERMWTILSDSAMLMQFFDKTSPEKQLIRNMVTINIELMRLFDSCGSPLIRTPEFTSELSWAKFCMSELQINFMQLAEIPLIMRIAFESQYVAAVHTYHELMHAQISDVL